MDDIDKNKWDFRKLLYSSLSQQRQENETNRIKIALVSVGATIVGIVGTINVIQSLSIPYLLLAILIMVYIPWFGSLYSLSRKLKVDETVIDEKIDSIGTDMEFQDPPSKELADKLDKRFHRLLIASLIGIICIITYIFVFTNFIK